VWCGYEVDGIITLCDLEPCDLFAVKTLCMFHLASFIILMHYCHLCGSCGTDKMFLCLGAEMSVQFLDQQINIKLYQLFVKNCHWS
jgi:hypothetical protein